jgi:hypothetical protein
VNGEELPVDVVPAMRVGDDVRLRVEADEEFDDVTWTVVERPAESAVEPTTPTLATTAFRAGDTLGFDVAGSYVVNADVGEGCEIALAVEPSPMPVTCVARVKSVNGVDVAPGVEPTLSPLDNVVLSLDQSVPSAVIAPIAGYLWEIIEMPLDSSVFLTSPTDVDTALELDAPGTIVVRATVVDSLGQSSTNDCRVTLNVVAGGTLVVELMSDVIGDGLDLHVEHDGIDCSVLDCPASWGGNAAISSDDVFAAQPTGPLSIAIRVVSTGGEDAGATVRVRIDGHLQYETFASVAAGATWEPARVEWPADPALPCVEDLSSPALECP